MIHIMRLTKFFVEKKRCLSNKRFEIFFNFFSDGFHKQNEPELLELQWADLHLEML